MPCISKKQNINLKSSGCLPKTIDKDNNSQDADMSSGCVPSTIYKSPSLKHLHLRNNGKNLCFSNSVVQLLSQTEIKYFLLTKLPTQPDPAVCVAQELSRLYKMERKEDSTTYLCKLTADKSMKLYLKSGLQQDADEFLRALLDVLEKELTGYENYTRIIRRYTGREVEYKKFSDCLTGKCKDCGNFPSAIENDFLTLKITIPDCKSQVNLDNLLDNYFTGNGSEIRMKCSTCCKCYPVCTQKGSCNRPAIEQ